MVTGPAPCRGSIGILHLLLPSCGRAQRASSAICAAIIFLDIRKVVMTETHPVTVVIVDDHPVVRDGLNAMLSTEADIQVVGEAGTGAEALDLLAKLRPAVVLMDLLLPDIGGAEVIKRVCSARSDTNFIVLTTVAGDEEIYRALEAGARGYLFKDMVQERVDPGHTDRSQRTALYSRAGRQPHR